MGLLEGNRGRARRELGSRRGACAGESAAPVFTSVEKGIIARNEALSTLVKTDPWTVRKTLDAIAASSKDRKSPAEAETKRLDLDDEASESNPAVDPERNPDLSRLQRASPEALFDLFQL